MAKDCLQNGATRLLVVDDDPELLNLFSQILRKEGYDLATAGNGNEALRFIRECPDQTHLLISDVEMPGMSGIELARRMATENPEVPVLLTSGSPLPSNTDCPFLIKPFTTQELLEKIHNVLDSDSTSRFNGRMPRLKVPVKAAVACLSIAAVAGFATWLWVKKTPRDVVQPREVAIHRVESA